MSLSEGALELLAEDEDKSADGLKLLLQASCTVGEVAMRADVNEGHDTAVCTFEEQEEVVDAVVHDAQLIGHAENRHAMAEAYHGGPCGH
ncbi:hypothetical protein [Streptomyces canus]|uniref:hypothetical protein n=1 Tax=Streptomyces canus TaxID=58343 RepID=UPI003425AC7F